MDESHAHPTLLLHPLYATLHKHQHHADADIDIGDPLLNETEE